MMDNRNFQGSCSCRWGISCINIVLWILGALLFLTVGAIIGAYIAELIVIAIAAIAVFAITLFVAIVITLLLARNRCRQDR